MNGNKRSEKLLDRPQDFEIIKEYSGTLSKVGTLRITDSEQNITHDINPRTITQFPGFLEDSRRFLVITNMENPEKYFDENLQKVFIVTTKSEFDDRFYLKDDSWVHDHYKQIEIDDPYIMVFRQDGHIEFVAKYSPNNLTAYENDNGNDITADV